MSSRSTSLEPKSQKPYPRKKTKKEKFPIKRAGENKKRKFPIEEWEKAKKGKKIPDQRVGESKNERKNSRSRIGRKQNKHAERSLDQQYLNNTEL